MPSAEIRVGVDGSLSKKREELRAMASICLNEDMAERLRRLDSLHEDWFSCDATREIYRRLRVYRAQTSTIPNYETLCGDSSLSPDVRAIVNSLSGLPGSALYSSAADWESFVTACKRNFITAQYHSLHTEMASVLSQAINGNYAQLGRLAPMLTVYQAAIAKHTSAQKPPVRIGSGGTDNSSILNEILAADRSAGRLKTGFAVFDRKTGGLRRGHALLMMSKYGGGKSAMALSMAINMKRNGLRVAYISYELGEQELYERYLTNISGIDGNKIRLGGTEISDSERDRIRSHDSEFQNSPGSLDLICPNTISAGGWNIHDTLQVIEGCEYDAVFFDYLGLIQYHQMEGISQAREDQILSDMARKIKIHAESHNYAAIVLHQMTEEGKIANSRAIGAHMDFIWKWAVNDTDKERGWVTVEQDKARGAPTYDMIFVLGFEHMRMMNVADPPSIDASERQANRSVQGSGAGRYTPLSMALTDFDSPR